MVLQTRMDGCLLWQCIVLIFIVHNPRTADGRQMCLSCASQTNVGLECLDDPWHWPMGNVRARCPFKCSLQVHRDIEKEEFTYAYRGCTAYGEDRDDGCEEVSGVQICYLSCVDRDYCNDWNATDVVTDGGLPCLSVSPWLNLAGAFLVAAFVWLG